MFAAAIGNPDHSVVRISRRFGLSRVGRGDAHVMPRFAFYQFAPIGDRPFFQMSGKPVRVIEEEVRS